ncbi:hypothetical protein C8Q70DRAFT_76981 [Cubamyces menziesii]|nr:hypothetical protein C8Q70DRAFT_76981 [Cubamyces menziesii]
MRTDDVCCCCFQLYGPLIRLRETLRFPVSSVLGSPTVCAIVCCSDLSTWWCRHSSVTGYVCMHDARREHGVNEKVRGQQRPNPCIIQPRRTCTERSPPTTHSKKALKVQSTAGSEA